MAYPRKRIHALPIRRGPDGSAFQKCESCGLSVAIALADMHECGAGRVVKKAKTQCGAKTRKEPSKNGDEMRFQGQPRSAFRLFMEEFVKKCKDGNAIDVDRGGFETWRCMSKKERQPYELQARKICSDYWQCLIMEENNMPLVDDEADSAEVGKYDKNYKDYMCSDDYDDSGEFLNFYSDESEGLNSHVKWYVAFLLQLSFYTYINLQRTQLNLAF
nr:high mobility group B protein 3-like isoform X1 [Ipomoea batatas]